MLEKKECRGGRGEGRRRKNQASGKSQQLHSGWAWRRRKEKGVCFAIEVTALTHGQKGKGASESKQEIPECQGQNVCSKTGKKKMCLVSWEKIGRKNREKMRSGQVSSQYCTGGGTPGKGTCTKSTEETGLAA